MFDCHCYGYMNGVLLIKQLRGVNMAFYLEFDCKTTIVFLDQSYNMQMEKNHIHLHNI